MTRSKKEIGVTIMETDKSIKYCGLDIGTGNICSAIMKDDKTTELSSIRNMFVTTDQNTEFDSIDFVKTSDGKKYILGNHALVLANIFNQVCRRPMAKGVINPTDIDALEVISLMIKDAKSLPFLMLSRTLNQS